MYFSQATIISFALLTAGLVNAHGKINLATGDLGGNGSAIGILGGIVANTGRNKVTELDTTEFKGNAADSCGRTPQGGKNNIETGTKAAMANSGPLLPQVSAGGWLQATVHIVTSDGAGPYAVLMDQTGTGNFEGAQKLQVMTQVPGNRGNIRKTKVQRDSFDDADDLLPRNIFKRATNINEEYTLKVAIPANSACTGTVAGQANVCIMKIVNPSNAGPFGGCVAVQMPAPGTAAVPDTIPAANRKLIRRKIEG